MRDLYGYARLRKAVHRAKRSSFLHLVKSKLHLKNVKIENKKIEHLKPFGVDLITSRAVADTKTLMKLCSNHLFGAVRKKDIAKEIGLTENNIILNKEIKELGQFEIKFQIGENKGKIFLVVC